MKVRKGEDSRRQKRGDSRRLIRICSILIQQQQSFKQNKKISYRYAPSERALGVHHINKERVREFRQRQKTISDSFDPHFELRVLNFPNIQRDAIFEFWFLLRHTRSSSDLSDRSEQRLLV